MPPKKKNDKPENVAHLLGRPGNKVKMGILGLPNVGKSALFNVLAKLQVPSENYPFCTIDPNIADSEVPDERCDFLIEHHHPSSKIYAKLSIVDIAGLVKGAHEGKGMGNAFLSHVNAVDGLFHVCRAFKAKEIEHVEGSVDPVRDLEVIMDELRHKDLATLASKEDSLQKSLRAAQASKGPALKAALHQMEVLNTARDLLKEKKSLRLHPWGNKDIDVVNDFLLLSCKPQVILVNILEKDFNVLKNKWIMPVKKWAAENMPGSPVIPFSASWEDNFGKMEEDEKKAFLADSKVPSMVTKIVHAGYKCLNLCHFFTCGPKEVRCWTVREGSPIPKAAGVIHGDFEKNFICAEIMHYADFKELGSEAEVRAKGKYHTKGKDYVCLDGDICFFKHNAGGAKKK